MFTIYDLVVDVGDVACRGTSHQEGQNLRDRYLAEVRGLVPIDTMAIHDSEHPETWDPSQLSLDTVTVLVDFSHLRNETSA